MPKDFPAHPLPWDGPEITAVCALNLRPAHLEGLTIIQHTLDAFDQCAVAGLAEDDHIANPDSTRRERKTRGQDKIALTNFRMKAVAADF